MFPPQELTSADPALLAALDPATIGVAMRKGILAFDAELFARIDALRTLRDISGSTAIMSIVTPTHTIFANVGDSRAVLSADGRVMRSTMDHKPQSTMESTRVVEAGGYILMGRVCGNLAVSRALGDFTYKEVRTLPPEKQKISPYADITVVPRTESDDFLIVACDGIWDVVTNQQAVSFVARLRKHDEVAEVVAEKLLDHCLRRGSTDNMSALVVYFPRSASKPKASQRMSLRFMRGAPRQSTGSVSSVASESEVVPKEVDHTRGRGSVSTLDPLDPAILEAEEAGQADPAAPDIEDTAEGEGGVLDEEEDIIPMSTDLSRGRGSFVLTEEKAAARRAELQNEAAGTEAAPAANTVRPPPGPASEDPIKNITGV
jgi:serine/threonine protein phosphatase PrpC